MAEENEFVINRATLSDQVYNYLRSEILTGHFAPGNRIDLGKMVERLKVSKMPVKEAIGRLVSEGLLAVQAQRGTFVSLIDPQELGETFEVRRALETLAGELAAESASKVEIERLRDLMAQMEKADDAGLHLGLNFEFHGLIVEMAGNRKLSETYHRLRVSIQIAGIHYRSENWVKRLPQERREHNAIVRALEKRDVGAVTRAISEHIKRGSASLLDDVARSVGEKRIESARKSSRQ